MDTLKVSLYRELENGVVKRMYPESSADIITYDNSVHNASDPVMNVQEKLDELSSTITSIDSRTSGLDTDYYTKADIDDILYEPVKIDEFTSSITKAEIGTSGYTTLTYKVTRMTKITSINVAGVDITNPDNSDIMTLKSFNGGVSVPYNSNNASDVQQTFTMTVVDTPTTNNNATTATKSVKINYYYPIFYGPLDSENISVIQMLSLNKYIADTNKGVGSYEFNAGSNNGYLWYCCQSGYNVSFSVGGFGGGFENPIILEDVDINGINTEYKCYRSTNRQTIDVIVDVN